MTFHLNKAKNKKEKIKQKYLKTTTLDPNPILNTITNSTKTKPKKK